VGCPGVVIASGRDKLLLALQPEIADEIDRLLRRSARLACLIIDDIPEAESSDSFHRGWGRSAMWDRYAERHAGACFVFDLACLAELAHEAPPLRHRNMFISRRVRYLDQALQLPIEGYFASREEVRIGLGQDSAWERAIGHLYLTKNRDWASEREWRLVKLIWNPEPAEQDAPVQVALEDSLLAVVFGEHHPSPRLIASAVRAERGDAAREFARCFWTAGAPLIEPL